MKMRKRRYEYDGNQRKKVTVSKWMRKICLDKGSGKEIINQLVQERKMNRQLLGCNEGCKES